ncbi:MAG: trigger factor [Eubacterium sp.]|nr:trigger factor [Eubacterium sp.]
MNKKIMIVLLSAVMAVSAAACGNGKGGKGSAGGSGQESTENKTKDSAAASDVSYDLEKDVKLGKYMGLKVGLPNTYKVTKKQIEEYAENVGQYYAKPTYKDTDKKTVEDGDTVNIDYEGKKDGVAFDGGTAADQYLTIGSNSFIDGFEDGLIGKKVGETVDLNLTFPEDYQSEEMAGADVVFTVTIHKIVKEDKSKKFELTDSFVQENFQCENVSEFKKQVKENLETMNENTKTSDTRRAVLEQLQKVCEATVPQELLDARVDSYIEVFTKTNVTEEGATLEDYLKEKRDGMTQEDFRKEVVTEMESSLKTEMILEAIAKKEGIEIDEEAFKNYVQQQMTTNGCEKEEDFYKLNGTDAESGEAYTRKIFLGMNALNVIVDNAKIEYGVTQEDTAADQDTKSE